MTDSSLHHTIWIQADEATHLTKVALAELEANGFETVKKDDEPP
jgi:hypothetical protein